MQKHYLFVLLFTVVVGLPVVKGQVDVTQINLPYTQQFDTLASGGTTHEVTTLPRGWTFLEAGTNANTTYAVSTGSANAGNTYSFGIDAADRALGGLQSGSLNTTIGAGFVNKTAAIITGLHIEYYGEQWRLGASDRGADRLDFQYSVDATSLGSGSWTDIDALDFSSPVTSGAVGARNGNDTLQRSKISFTITGLNIAPGAAFFLRWLDFNVTNADDALAIDNFSMTPQGVPSETPAITFVPGALNFGYVALNSADTLSYQVIGSNIDDSIAAFAFRPEYTLSTDGVLFTSSITLPDSGGVVYVRFAPTAHGVVEDSILHASGSTLGTFGVSGYGFDQVASIISIAEARAKAIGERVTVAGRITVADELGNPAYLQDSTGGLPVFHYALASRTNLGDSVIVTGVIDAFNDQKQIGNDILFTIVDTPRRIIMPQAVRLSDLAAYEGMLVTVENVTLKNKAFVFYPQSTEQILQDSAVADLRIDGDTNIPGLAKPQDTTTITGVVGRFKTNVQLLPRFREDIPGATDPSVPTDSIPKAKTLDIVTWNVAFFGARKEDYQNKEYGPADEALQLQNVRRVLDSLNADIIAVEEVSDDSLFNVLVSQLGSYSGICSPRYSYSFNGPDDTFPPQKVCFIYDTTTITLLSARPMFEKLYDSARTTDPSLLPGYPGGDASSFYSSGRLPYEIVVKATLGKVTEEISLIAIHAKSGAAAEDRNRRAYDAAVLKDTLDTYYGAKKVIILGDLNDDLDQSIVSGEASPYKPFVDDTLHYASITKVLSDQGARSTMSFQDVIDHQLITRALFSAYVEGSAQIMTPFAMIGNYATTTSDHLPVITRYEFSLPVISFVGSGAAVTEDSTAAYTINLIANKPFPSAVQLRAQVSGTARYEADYNSTPAVMDNVIILNLPAGDSSASFTIAVVDDMVDEDEETITFTLLPSTGASEGSSNVFTLTVADNDVPAISFIKRTDNAKEGTGEHVIVLKLSTPPTTDQTAVVSVVDGLGVEYGLDYTTEPPVLEGGISLSIPAGSTEASFVITPLPDQLPELPFELVTFFIGTTSPGLQATTPRLSAFTIINVNKGPHFTVFPNPTFTGTVRISSDDLPEDKIVEAVLRNPSGVVRYAGSGTLAQISTAVSHALQHGKRGLYTLNLTVDGAVHQLRLLSL